MPWIVVKKGNKSCVVNKQTGSVKGCHPTRREALAQLRALYVNVPEARDEKDHAKRD
jgi:hypothetical protein